MATGGQCGQLTNEQISDLVKSIANVEIIGLFYLGLSAKELVRLKNFNRGDPEAFRREIFQSWASINPGPNQVQVRV